MKVLKRKMLNVLLAFVMVFSFAFSGWGGIFTAMSVKAETAVVELTFNTLGLNGGENNDNTFGDNKYYTCIRFTTGVFSGDASGAFDFSDLTEKASYVGSGNTDGQWGFAPAYSKWPQGYKNDAVFNFIYLWTANKPASDDTIAMKAGSYFTFSGTFADGSGACDDKYVLAEDINLKFNGTAWETYVPVVDNTQWVTEFTNDGQFVVGNYNGDAVNYPYEIIDGSTESLPAGYTGAVAKIGSKVNGGAAYINIDFTTSQIPATDVESVVARVYSPDYTADDLLRINGVSGSLAAANLSTWCDVALPLDTIKGADGNLGSFGFGLRDKGTVSDYFYIDSITVNMVKPPESVPVTFTGVHSYWNNYFYSDAYCSIIEFSGGIGVGSLDGDYSDVFAKATLDGQPVDTANLSFVCRAWIDGGADSIIMQWVTIPAAGSILHIPAGAKFTNGGSDTNIYEFAQDLYLKSNGTTWETYTPPVEPEVAPVTFTNINVTWNNYSYENTYCTFLQFDGGISGNGGLDGDYSDLLSKMTINGEAVDGSNFSFICPNWIGASGGIIFRFVTNPAVGAKMVLPAGATFTIGGSDTNVYKITADITLVFNGSIWAEPVKVSYSVYETMDPEVIHTYTTTQNTDGSFTYTLPEYEREGKVLLGYVMNYMENEAVAQTFIPSGEYTTDATVLAFIALWGEFKTLDGASIRISSAETSGIRWTTNIDEEGFNNIAYWAKNGFTFGTELSADGFDENFDIVANVWKVENSQYTGVLTDINSKYYTQEFTARGYVDITYHNGVTKRIYAIANDTTRSIKEVAEKAIASGDYSGTQLTILQQIAGV